MHIKVIFASTSGNVEAVTTKVSKDLEENGFDISISRAEQTDFQVILDNDLFIFSTSTWEHGEINPFFLPILKEMKKHDMSGKRAIFIGLGDLRYEPVLFCGGMEQLKETFTKQGGKEIFTPLRINGEPYKYFDTTIKTWTNRLIDELKKESNES